MNKTTNTRAFGKENGWNKDQHLSEKNNLPSMKRATKPKPGAWRNVLMYSTIAAFVAASSVVPFAATHAANLPTTPMTTMPLSQSTDTSIVKQNTVAPNPMTASGTSVGTTRSSEGTSSMSGGAVPSTALNSTYGGYAVPTVPGSTYGGTTTSTSPGDRAYENMVFLGDSLTAGYEPDRTAKNFDGFTTRLKEEELFRGHASANNQGILGLTSSGLRNYMDAVTAGKTVSTHDLQKNLRFPAYKLDGAKIADQLRKANLITITIGGNDFLDALGPLEKLPNDLSKMNLKPVITRYQENMEAILNQLTALNPSATIVVADQYQPVPELVGEDLYRDLNALATEFSNVVSRTVSSYDNKQEDVRMAHMFSAFKGKELDLTHIADKDIHPTQTGYTVMAQVFSQTIWGKNGYRTPPTTTKDKNRVVVYTNGKLFNSSAPPIMRDGRLYVALSDVATELNAKVSWSAGTKQAAIIGDKPIIIPINSRTILVDGKSVTTDAPAFVQQGKTYVPIVLLANQLDYDLQYVKRWKAVFIRK